MSKKLDVVAFAASLRRMKAWSEVEGVYAAIPFAQELADLLDDCTVEDHATVVSEEEMTVKK